MAKYQKFEVQESSIRFYEDDGWEFISLTDIAKQNNEEPRFIIQNWMKNTNTIRYLYEWEVIHNPDASNRVQLHTVLESSTNNRFTMSPKKWIELVDAVGITSSTGRYGGTYAHWDIVMNFCFWLDPVFQIYVNKEFKRLKEDESRQQNLDWNLKRTISKMNYRVHTDAIREHLIPPLISKSKSAGMTYATEADILNVAMFGMTAREWKQQNPDAKGNLRDHATNEQLVVLSNLEAINAELIRSGLARDERVSRLNQAARNQMRSVVASSTLPQLGSDRTT